VSIANAESTVENAWRKSGALALASSTFTNKAGIASRYGVSHRTVDNWVRQRRIPYLKCGRLVRFNIARCDAALGRFEVKEIA
jgi:excisionase family DNA binding protein